MADKEAAVFILDLGASMAATNGGRKESDLDWSMSYVWDKITNVVASNRKTLCVGVVGFRTDETNHTLEEEGYENISVLQQLGPMSMSSLKALQSKIRASGTVDGDAISAIVIAVDMIDNYTKKNKWKRQIYLITDGRGEIDPDDIGDIARKTRDSNIELTVLGVDFDAPDYGFKEEDKNVVKKQNEETLKKLVDSCGKDARFASMVEAIDDMNEPRAKSIKPYKTYDGLLTLGDPKNAPAVVEIHVERYFKTHLARPPMASTVVVKEEQPGPSQAPDDEQMDGMELTAVKQTRTYKVNDPDAPGGKRDVEFESLAKGYEYGRTAVHISESDHNITKLETHKSFKIIGFVSKEKYEALLNLGETCITIAAKYDEKSELAFSSLVWALSELDSYAVARLVTKDEKEPLMVLMMPHMEPNYVCLYDVPLPFAEDIRTYQFPPLDRVITVSGQTITKHRLLPSDELSQAMSDYVDAMDLSNYGIDQDGEPAEYATIDEIYNPAIHRITHAVKQRAVHPEKSIPEIPPVLLRFAAPPTELVETMQAKIDALVQAADVKKVPPKAKGKRPRETVKPISGLDVDALLGKEKKGSISPENSIPDFKRALNTSEEVEQIADATKQMGVIVRTLVTDSFGDNKYAQAMEGIGAMREELTNLEEPGLYNDFVRDLKKSLLSGALGGDRRDFWFKVRWAKLGLIDKNQSEVSTVTLEEADEHHLALLLLLSFPTTVSLRLSVLKDLGVSVQYGEHVREEELDERASINFEDEFPTAGTPQQGANDAAPYDAGRDAWNSTAHPSAEKQRVLGGITNSHTVAPLDCSKFIAGEPMDETIDFCSWKVIRAYPDHFIGKANKPRAQPFFDKILEGRVWDFFYLYNPERPYEKPRLLVPSVQLESFLRDINRELGTSLAIPGGINQDRFYMRFGQGNTPRPRYLKRSRDQKVLNVESFPEFQQEDLENFKASHTAIQQDWKQNWQMMIPRPAPQDKKKNAARKAAQKKLDRERMLLEAQEYLHLQGNGNGRDVVLLCMDVEAIETPPNPISEIGIAILDVKDLHGVQPGPGGQNWWQFVKAHHLRTKEYSGLVNHRYVHGCPSYFDFGISTFPEEFELPEAIEAILAPYKDKKRQLVFVGHDGRQDIKYLSSVGFEVLAMRGLVEQLDTKEIHQAWKDSEQGKSLLHVLNDLFIHSKHLHNAGNDAVFTLRALIGVAIEEIREQEAKAKGQEYTPALRDVEQDPVVERNEWV
ncbi:hypothetical protein V8C37DRAFT_412904 [Trichoderma ceciliae]